ncbi:hypothetical protein BU16DRAFT_524362 [Lophium mytilinum]|uniref:Uncharacterized protein n=1 Tax=Lophium mytilinum TaxID=390894 RepID=A0A6A6R133_9PEZI|nr:hypothetical protein BU16DRAFT_524362 [Lophium mytilinum]
MQSQTQEPPQKRRKLEHDAEVFHNVAEETAEKAGAESLSFFSLPGEIRNKIYDNIFQDKDYKIHLPQFVLGSNTHRHRPLPQLTSPDGIFVPHHVRDYYALLAVNRQMRKEVASLIFSNHLHLSIETPSGLKDVAQNVGNLGLSYIRHLALDWYTSGYLFFNLKKEAGLSISSLLQRFTQLKTVVISVDCQFTPRFTKAAAFVEDNGLQELRAAGIEVSILGRWDPYLIEGEGWGQSMFETFTEWHAEVCEIRRRDPGCPPPQASQKKRKAERANLSCD